jgi:ubiquinone/menaquinone biosynthesis C-methylase UbiE
MSAAPTIWDYSGIVAAAYDHYFGAEPYWDQAFYESRLRANGGRALEVACGSGRLLLPLARDGLQVEGLDTSRDMLDRLRARARVLNLSPVLHEAPMQDFDLTRRYRTVFVPATSFGILVQPDEIAAALACFWRALEPGGEVLVPVSEASAASEAVADWRVRRDIRLPEEDAQLVVFERIGYEDDGRLQRWYLRYEVRRRQRPRQVFFREHAVRHYGADEFRALLQAAGFEGIEVRRGYTEPQSSDPEDDLVFSARRPSGR